MRILPMNPHHRLLAMLREISLIPISWRGSSRRFEESGILFHRYFILVDVKGIEVNRMLSLAMHQETGRNIYLGAIHVDEALPNPDDILQVPPPLKMEYRIVARRTSIRSLLGNMLLQSEVANGQPPGAPISDLADQLLRPSRAAAIEYIDRSGELTGYPILGAANQSRIARQGHRQAEAIATVPIVGYQLGLLGPGCSVTNEYEDCTRIIEKSRQTTAVIGAN